jgi:uncharacterized protein YrrD
MDRSIKELRGLVLCATDAEIGKVADVLFDDESFTIRYVVVDTGSWLTGRQVLLSTLALRNIDSAAKLLNVNLSRAQVEASPDISSDEPVSRQHEIALYDHYGYLPYWGVSGFWGLGLQPAASAIVSATSELSVPEASAAAAESQRFSPPEPAGDLHLRSANDLIGYAVISRASTVVPDANQVIAEDHDSELGHVADFILSDVGWSIRELVIDTGRWLPGRKLRVPRAQVGRVLWDARRIELHLSREAMQTHPEFDGSVND